MKIYDLNSDLGDYKFLFNIDLIDSLEIAEVRLRSEADYIRDPNPGITALKYLSKVAQSYEGNIFLIVASENIAPSNRLRSKKDSLWKDRKLPSLSRHDCEVKICNDLTRLVSVVDLKGYAYDCSDDLLLNWLYSLTVFTALDLDEMCLLCKQWLTKKQRSALAFDYACVAESLLSLKTTSVLRYFPPDNGRCELMAVLGLQHTIEKHWKFYLHNLE